MRKALKQQCEYNDGKQQQYRKEKKGIKFQNAN